MAATATMDEQKLQIWGELVSSLNGALMLLPTPEDAEAADKPFMAERIRKAQAALAKALDIIDPYAQH